MPRKGSVGLTIESSIDMPAATAQLMADERQVLARGQTKALTAVREQWVNWLYRGRPAGAPRNVSFKAWKGTRETTKPPYNVVIFNAATTTKGELYAGFVHRSGTDVLEADVVRGILETNVWPQLAADIDAAIKANIGKPRRVKQVRVGSQGAAMRRTGGLEL
jgi:hypothetical protein